MTLATASIAAITSSVSTINSNMTLATASIAAITASVSSLKSTSFAGTAGTETVFSGSATSTGSFGRVEATNYSGDGSALTGIDIPTAAAISGSVVSGVSGSSVSTGSFGRVEVAGDLSVAGNGQGWVKLSTQTLSADTSPVVMGSSSIFSTTYNHYMITGHYLTPKTDGDIWYIRFKVDDSIQTSNYRYVGNETMGASASPPEYWCSNGTSWIRFFGYGGTTAGESLDFQIFLANPDSSPATFPKIWWHGVGVDRDGTCRTCRGMATNTGTTGNLDEILLYSTDDGTGDTGSGTFTVYGLTI